MNDAHELGKAGEEYATQYLLKEKYKIIDRNFSRPWGELDIIAREKGGTLVFVEVKTLHIMRSMMPEDNMTKDKIKKFARTAELYANANPKLVNEKQGWRLDVIALTRLENNFQINHYKNIDTSV
jgi:putative endonuclease